MATVDVRNTLFEWRLAWRALLRRPAFFASAVLTLAFGAGITTAVFSLVDTVLIRPLPFPDAERLVTVYESSPSSRERTSLVAPARLEDWNRMNRSFAALSGSYNESVTDTSGADPERLAGRRVSPRFFTVYGVSLLAGRVFTAEEEQANGPGAAVISEGFWTRRFQRDPNALGRVLTIGGKPYPIVGVLPKSFTSAATEVWLPAQMGERLLSFREARFLQGIGRLKPGVTIEQGASDLAAVQAELGRTFPKTDANWSAEIRSLKDAGTSNARRGLVLVFSAVASLWIIAVANIAGLMLVQVQRRARELAVRTALGASRARVIATVVREGLVIALVGATAGAAIAGSLIGGLRTLLATNTPRINELALDWRALTFVLVTSVLAACAFSLAPALAATRPRVNAALSSSSRSVAGGQHGLQRGLVIGQVALSVLLVGSATLLLWSYRNLTNVETGFETSNVITFHVAARWDENRTQIAQMQVQLLERLQEMPHVRAAGLTNFLPVGGASLRYQVKVQGLTGPNADGSMTVGMRTMSGGYLPAIRARLAAGQWCPGPTIDFKAPMTGVLNQRFIDTFAPGQNLVGRTLVFGGGPLTVTGIVADLAEDGPASTPVPFVYTCPAAGAWPDPEYVAWTNDTRAFVTDLRRLVREIDPTRAVFGVRALQEVFDTSLDQPRMNATMVGLFAAAALALAAIGLYSLFTLVVSDRAREMAVRLAIGAEPRQMMALVMAGAGRLLAAGIVIGIALTAAADRVLRGVLFGVTPFDARALGAAVLTLAIVALIAVAGPALRAARIAPVDALRGD